MKEKENTVPTARKKRLLYSVILAVCALLLVVATVLTVYFVTNSKREVLDNPPTGGELPPPDDDPPTSGEEPSGPTGGQTVAFILPLDGASSSVEHNSVYENKTLDKWYYHKGVDYAAPEGTDVRCIADGKIVLIDLSEKLGNIIEVQHADGVCSSYRFVEPVSGLKVGDSVKQGDVIGHVSAAYGTESKDGTHLHLEMTKDEKQVDPADYIDSTLEEK